MALALTVPGCRGNRDGAFVLAAASLGAAFRDLADGAPELGVEFSFAGSQALVEQVRAGAPADVVAVADAGFLEPLATGGFLAGDAVLFATNELVAVARPGSNLEAVADLADDGVRVVLAGESVPAGAYARAGLAELGLLAGVERNVVATEPDVVAVAARVALGEVDAGVVYATDTLADDRLVVLGPIPGRAQYAAALLADAPHPDAGRAFLRHLTDPVGAERLRRHGFTPAERPAPSGPSRR